MLYLLNSVLDVGFFDAHVFFSNFNDSLILISINSFMMKLQLLQGESEKSTIFEQRFQQKENFY